VQLGALEVRVSWLQHLLEDGAAAVGRAHQEERLRHQPLVMHHQ
jgi:hypothetical protein